MVDKTKKDFIQEHFYYEATEMLLAVQHGRRLIKLAAENNIPSQWVENISLECFLTHGRNLLEFFYRPSDKHPRAEDFLKEGVEWSSVRPPMTDNIKQLQRRVDTELSHLDYKRISGKPPEKLWRLDLIYTDMLEVIRVFLESIQEGYLTDRLEEVRNYAKKRVAHIKTGDVYENV
jgi:hypothetical protein